MRIFFFLPLVLLCACTTANEKPILYKTFQEYTATINTKNAIKMKEKYFDEAILSDIDDNETLISYLNFHTLMNNVHDHLESINNKNACLTIQGFSKDKQALSFNIEYKKKNSRWLIYQIDMLWPNNIEDFSKTARCPSSYLP